MDIPWENKIIILEIADVLLFTESVENLKWIRKYSINIYLFKCYKHLKHIMSYFMTSFFFFSWFEIPHRSVSLKQHMKIYNFKGARNVKNVMCVNFLLIKLVWYVPYLFWRSKMKEPQLKVFWKAPKADFKLFKFMPHIIPSPPLQPDLVHIIRYDRIILDLYIYLFAF